MAQRWFTVAYGEWRMKRKVAEQKPGVRLRLRFTGDGPMVQELHKSTGRPHRNGRQPEQVAFKAVVKRMHGIRG